MSSFEPVISVQELDNYTALVNAALGAAHAKSMRYRHGGGALPTHVNVTLVYAPAVSKGESQRSTAPTQVTWQSSCDVIVGATAPTTYARGQVWLRTGATSADENTFFVSSTTSPTAAYWHPISDPSLLFSTDRAVALADTSVLKHLDSLVKMDANGDITDAAAVAALQAVPGLGGSGGGVVLALGITDSGATGRDLLRAATPAVAKTALAIAAADVSGLSAAATSTLKTINGTSILGSGDIVISGGGGSVTINTTLTSTSTTEAASASTVKTLQDTKAPRGGPGAALGATYTAVEADDGKIRPTPVNCVVTVNTGLPEGFGQGFTGAGVVSFVAGAGVTFPADYDKRTAGVANPVCSLVNIGLNTYEIWGTKA